MSANQSQTHEPRSDALPFDSGHLNQQLLKTRLPAWFYNAPRELREALRRSLLQGQFSRRAVEPLRTRLLPVEQFARPLLEQALYKRFNVQLDVTAHQLVTMRYEEVSPLRRLVPFKQTLLEAALHNFEESEANPGYFQPGSALLPVDGLQLQLVEGTGTKGTAPRFRYEYRGVLAIKPEPFAELCHGLDLGGKYQAHLDSVFKPVPSSGQTREAAAQAVAEAFMNCERDALEVLAHIARMKKHLSAAAWQMLQQMVKTNGEPRWDGQPVRYRQLHMLGDRTFEGSPLYGALLIELDIPGVENGPCVVYMPGEPEHPLKEYPSLMALLVVLRRKLLDKEYQQYFRRFVSLRHSQHFFTRLNERLTPLSRVEGSSLLKPLYEYRFNPAADLALEAQDVGQPPFEMLYEHLRSKTYDDSRRVAVPSRDEDQNARQRRMQYFESQGLNLLNVMGFFVPVLGEVMSVLAAGQLLHEVFFAVEEWRHGDLNEALDHLFEIAENLASVAVSGAATGIRPQLEPSGFIESLTPVTLRNGQTRLWKPELTHFAHEIALPAGLPADSHGRIEALGKTWLTLAGRHYRIELDAALQQWRVRHPHDIQRHGPVVEHHGGGCWRSEFENPLGWDEITAFRRLGTAEQSLTDEGMHNALNITGADEALVRQVHVERMRSPALLNDCAQRLLIDQQIDHCIQAMRSGHLYQVVTPNIEPWIKRLASAPRWPTGRALRLIDTQGAEVARWGVVNEAASSVIDIKWQSGGLDTLLRTVADGLEPHELQALLDTRTTQTTAWVQRLASYLAQCAEMDRAQLLEDIYAVPNRSSDPHVNVVQRDFQTVPVVVANELLSTANTVQLQRMTESGRLPLEIAEHAREYVQQLRVNRANEGFYLEATANPDTAKVGLQLLEHLPGWPGGIAIELRQESAAGELLDSMGTHQAAQVQLTIAKTSSGYLYLGGEGTPDALFFDALLRALPDSVRSRIGLSSTATEQHLRRLLGDLAVTRRETVADILDLQAIKPGFKWPLRLADGRVGYPLSGRLRGLFNRLGLAASRYSPELAVKSLFPRFTDEQVSAFLADLRREHLGSSAQLNLFLKQRLDEMAAEYKVLKTTLSGWVDEMPTSSSMHSARVVAADRLRRCWTRIGTLMHGEGGEVLGYSLDLCDLTIGRLPRISARFDHVAFLTLKNTYLTNAQVDVFLGLFKNLVYLSLQRNRLFTLPAAVGGLSRLKRLWLSHNPLTLNAESLGHLQRLRQLHLLDLNYCPLDPNVSFAGIHPLRCLLLRSTGINWVPEHVLNWPELTELDLRENQISTLSLDVLRRLDRVGLRARLHDNPLSAVTLERADNALGAYAQTRLGLNNTRGHASLLLPTDTPWFLRVENNVPQPRLQQWIDLATIAESSDFFRILNDLALSADFVGHREALIQRVWGLLDAASANSELREQLFSFAAHPRTCGDGISIIFSELEIQVLIFDIKTSTSRARQPVQLFKLARGLDRLDELEKIAQADIAARLLRGETVDQAEVRLGYRVGLAKALELPAQPRSMLFSNLSGVTPARLAIAQRQILDRERTSAFMQSLIERDFWMDYLQEHFAAKFASVKDPFVERIVALDSREESLLSDQQYLDEVATITQERREAVEGLAIRLSEAVADQVLEEEGVQSVVRLAEPGTAQE
ncbi:NEL-type E3 ubiquitin ligase domain-containing protein [Pseudomonas folii]|uniref:RING-type E3 ubiquitin transferase n=1 Tax=Pseudomonas folii TaxID=2762593 RepID=A0ABR7B4C0_9PSED|nr:NEL-type E3 ubiquitin ligase domain-containing protein [Pseudomonas folii]MBC3951989.1 hypothetical protein [Pseudomonas folii]